MNNSHQEVPPLALRAGCLGMALALMFLCLMPIMLVDTMRAALEKLHLSPLVALVSVVGIIMVGMVIIPIYRIDRLEEQLVELAAIFGIWGWTPRLRRARQDTIVAVNVGGCLIPLAIACWQMVHLLTVGGWPMASLGFITTVNVLACYVASWPVEGIGIAMAGFTSPAAVLPLTWLLLPAEYASLRASVAFVAGVLGPLIGADLLHLKDVTKVSAGVLSIGGAGTFDGIVLSGVLAALLA
jgi:uncharacterized membrane protein